MHSQRTAQHSIHDLRSDVVCVFCFRSLVSKVYLRCLYLFASVCKVFNRIWAMRCVRAHVFIPQSVYYSVRHMNITSLLCYFMHTLCEHCSPCIAHSVCVCVSIRSFITDSDRWKYCLHVKMNSIVLSSEDLLLNALINRNNERERKEINWHACVRALRINMHCIWNYVLVRNTYSKSTINKIESNNHNKFTQHNA